MKDEDILDMSRKGLETAVGAESSERALMLDDLRFCALDQWPEAIRAERENDPEGPRPCLTIDKINQYIVQVGNDMRQNRPSIKVRPFDDASDVRAAKVFQGIIRHIEDRSKAHIAYETAGESTVRIGMGHFRVLTEYSGSGFGQGIRIVRIPNSFSVYLGQHLMPDGSDAREAWVFEQMPKKTFERRYPKAKSSKEDFAEMPAEARTFWSDGEHITICEYFYLETGDARERVLLDSGEEMDADEYEKQEDTPESPRSPVSRSRTVREDRVRWCKHTGVEVLEKRDWAGKYIPIVEVIGREAYVDGKRTLWGLVRPAKDTLRMYNYWSSALTEKMALAPKAPFIGAVGQFEGFEERWKQANKRNFAYLEYQPLSVNGNALPAPRRQEPTQMEAAIVQVMGLIEHDVQTSLGMFKASVGQSESQQSGRAILALQRESDTATFHFSDNLANSIAHLGRILVDLIPKIYSGKHVLRIIGENDEESAVTIDSSQDEAVREVRKADGSVRLIYNLGVGEYDVTTTVGPSYNTKRMEAAAVFTELAKGAADPASAAVMRYLTVKNLDLTSSEEATGMLRSLLPPPAQQAIAAEGPMPAQAVAKITELMQAMEQMKMQGAELAQENQQLKSGAQTDMAKVEADAQAKRHALELQAQNDAEEARLAREKAEADFALKKWVAEQEAALAEQKCAFEQDARVKDAEHQRQVKLASDPNYKDVAMMPEVMTGMGGMAQAMQTGFEQVAALLQAQNAGQAQVIALLTNPPPRTVSIGGITKDADGQITGARVNTRLN